MQGRLRNRWNVVILLLVVLHSLGCIGRVVEHTGCNVGFDLEAGRLTPSDIAGEECCAIPTIDASLVTVDFVVIATDDVTKPWRLDATIEWSPPPNDSLVDYRYSVGFDTATKLQDLETLQEDAFAHSGGCTSEFDPADLLEIVRCPEEPRFSTVSNENSTVFRDLLFGFLYNLEIQVIAGDIISSTRTCIADCYRFFEDCPDTVAPDCLESTGDEEFCRNQPIALSSEPRNFSAEEAVNSTGSTFLSLSWLHPLQVNMFVQLAQYEIVIHFPNQPDINDPFFRTVCQPPNASCSYEVPIGDAGPHEFSLNRGEAYIIRTRSDFTLRGELFEIPNTSHIQEIVPRYFELDADFNWEPAALLLYPLVDIASYTGFPNRLRRGNFASLTVNITLVAATTPTAGTTKFIEPPGDSPEPTESFPVVAVAVASCVVILAAAVLFAVLVCRCLLMDRNRTTKEQVFIKELSPHMRPTAVVLPEFAMKEIFGDNIVLESDSIGSGQYGQVYAGFICADKVQDDMIQVAVKTTKAGLPAAMKEEFLDEIRLMLDIGDYPNIMAVLGCRTVEEPYYLVIEYMVYGSLKDYLKQCRKPEFVLADSNYDLTEKRKLDIAHQISCGMAFLSSTRYFHGDLAARNVLINAKMVVKISDFGLSNDIYARGYTRLPPEKKRPVKWYSPEANLHGRCSTKGDVWSFGVVLYEIYTSGGEPYPGMHPREVIQKVNRGYRMEKPDGCPDKMYELMTSCWQFEAPSRPPFSMIKKELEVFIENWDAFVTPTSEKNLEPENDSNRYSSASFTSDASLTGKGGGELEPDFS